MQNNLSSEVPVFPFPSKAVVTAVVKLIEVVQRIGRKTAICVRIDFPSAGAVFEL